MMEWEILDLQDRVVVGEWDILDLEDRVAMVG